jgi:hypothetical protein
VPDTLPTRIAADFAWAPLEAWVSAAASATEYAARAVTRKRSPLCIAEDIAEFARVATLREKPTWASDPREVGAWTMARLLDYSAPSATAGVPTLVMGRAALNEHWKPIAERVRMYSSLTPDCSSFAAHSLPRLTHDLPTGRI